MIITREQFIWKFTLNGNGEICNCFENISINGYKFINENASLTLKLPKVFYVSLFPDFFNANLIESEKYNLKKVLHTGYSGAGINISKHTTVESYLGTLNRNRLLKNIKRNKNRLEKDFNISYEINYGNISEEKCDYLLKTLKDMIFKRFENKNTKHAYIMEWEKNIKGMVTSINQKKSSLFVIYSEEKPISIRINRHINNTLLVCDVHSYDINFSKYGLGNLNYYINLDWCIKNSILFMDLGFGVSNIKKKWCNTFYETHYLIYYKKNDILAYFVAQFEIIKIKLKNYIKKILDYLKIKKIDIALKNK